MISGIGGRIYAFSGTVTEEKAPVRKGDRFARWGFGVKVKSAGITGFYILDDIRPRRRYNRGRPDETKTIRRTIKQQCGRFKPL
jgi:hypothetical protein